MTSPVAEQIIQAIKSANPDHLCEDALDDMVYDVAGAGSSTAANQQKDGANALFEEAEARASSINNGGFESQIEFLLENGVAPADIYAELDIKPIH